MKLDLYDFYQDAKGKNVIFYYCGPIAHASIEGVAQTLRKNLEYEEAGNLTAQSVFSVFIEQMQNILNYSAERVANSEAAENELRVGVVVIGHEQKGYFILCGNKVYNRDIQGLTDKLELIRHMNKEELKALYKERRRMDPAPESKGAGLGLIEMARKGTDPIEYSFLPIDQDFSFFTIRVVVGR
ncbi:MAG TPA: SiaB family protein kinase [Anaerovoracaceae bacterium]|nr:SiaB family protein kinase [Anaerovoracaceae bacterium]